MKKIALGVLLSASVFAALPANAAVVKVGSATALGQNDSVTWGQLGTAQSSTPKTFSSVNGTQGTISDSSGPFQVLTQGTSWFGNFATGTNVVYNIGAGTLTLNFAQAIRGVGAQVQSDTFGIFTGAMTVNGGTLGSFAFNGNSSSASNNTAIFAGVLSDIANITSVTYSMTTPNSSFAIGSAALNVAPVSTGAVPEPATWAMLILGMAAIGYSMRRSNVKFDAKIKRMTAAAA